MSKRLKLMGMLVPVVVPAWIVLAYYYHQILTHLFLKVGMSEITSDFLAFTVGVVSCVFPVVVVIGFIEKEVQ